MGIFLGTILLEQNRWNGRGPSITASKWIDRAITGGFDGVELWADHFLKSDGDEAERLVARSDSIRVFSAYCGFEDDMEGERDAVLQAVGRLRPSAVKFNLGKDSQRAAEYRRNLVSWVDQLEAVPYCECHRHTIVDEPHAAKEVFSGSDLGTVRIVVHPFGLDEIRLTEWFRVLGERIAHAHVQGRDENGELCRLRDNADGVTSRVALMKRLGYSGSWTLEFTRDTRDPEASAEALYTHALDDLAFLRELGL